MNQKFADTLLKHVDEDDTIWVHDYQLMLVPQMVREKKHKISIGFFLHIPFPSYEIFRTLPWREEVLEGLLGSDLIGFHTYDYQRHFLSSVRRLLGLEVHFDEIYKDNRIVKADSFPMGIDYKKFNEAARVQADSGAGESEIVEVFIDTPAVAVFVVAGRREERVDRAQIAGAIGPALCIFEEGTVMLPDGLIEGGTAVAVVAGGNHEIDVPRGDERGDGRLGRAIVPEIPDGGKSGGLPQCGEGGDQAQDQGHENV